MLFGDKFSKIEKLGEKNKVDKLKKFADSKDSKIRLAVAKALGNCKGDEAFNLLVLCLRDPDLEARAAVIESIGKLHDPRAMEHLRRQMEKEDDENIIKTIEQAIKNINV